MSFSAPHVSWLAAFVAGLASFLTPCVLPLIPVYISMLAGASVAELSQGTSAKRGLLLRNGLLFILGFSIVFIALGAGASEAGRYLLIHLKQAERVAGALVLLLSLFMLGLIKIPFLQRTFKIQTQSRGLGPLSSLLLGLGFAFGWTPCVGPIFGSILAVAATGQSLLQGMLLLSWYALGLALPFFMVLISAEWVLPKLRNLNRYTPWIEKGSGILLLILGALMVTGNFSKLSVLLGQ